MQSPPPRNTVNIKLDLKSVVDFSLAPGPMLCPMFSLLNVYDKYELTFLATETFHYSFALLLWTVCDYLLKHTPLPHP